MLTLKAKYEKGRIELLDPMPADIERAELHVIVIPSEKRKETLPSQEDPGQPGTSEAEFKETGLTAFFDTEDDAEIDWEEYFGLK